MSIVSNVLTDLEMSELIYSNLTGDQSHKNAIMEDWFSASTSFLNDFTSTEKFLSRINQWMKKNKLFIKVTKFIDIEEEESVDWQVEVQYNN